MNIYTLPGTKVRFTAEGGQESENAEARSLLEIGGLYTVKETEVGNWCSEVYLEEVKGGFNTVMFEDAEDLAAKISKSQKILFVVEMCRNNSREEHSYTIGIWEDEIEALKEAWAHMNLRAEKYGALVIGYEINGGKQVYKRELDQWNAFANSCTDTAKKIKEMLDRESS